jgi:heterodisulfide reductase subunit B
MDYGYFPGCSLKSTAKEYDATVRAVCRSFGVNLIEINDWVHAISEEISLALPLRNLLHAEAQGLQKVLSPCPACHSHMLCSHEETGKDDGHQQRLQELAGGEYNRTIQLRHLVDFLFHEVGIEDIKAQVKKPLQGIKAVSYYGCLTRLPGIEIEDKEMPTMIDEIIAALGAEPLRWSHTTECCGASFAISKADIVVRLVREILSAAKRAGADCVIVVCPLCQSNLDMRQVEIQKRYGDRFNLPIIYLSQLILMSQGHTYQDLQFSKHLIDPQPLLMR